MMKKNLFLMLIFVVTNFIDAGDRKISKLPKFNQPKSNMPKSVLAKTPKIAEKSPENALPKFDNLNDGGEKIESSRSSTSVSDEEKNKTNVNVDNLRMNLNSKFDQNRKAWNEKLLSNVDKLDQKLEEQEEDLDSLREEARLKLKMRQLLVDHFRNHSQEEESARFDIEQEQKSLNNIFVNHAKILVNHAEILKDMNEKNKLIKSMQDSLKRQEQFKKLKQFNLPQQKKQSWYEWIKENVHHAFGRNPQPKEIDLDTLED